MARLYLWTPQIRLLQKTLLNIEALGRQLDPNPDLWKTAKPFLEKWMKERLGPRAFFSNIKNQLPRWIDQLPDLPNLVQGVLRQATLSALLAQAPETPIAAAIAKNYAGATIPDMPFVKDEKLASGATQFACLL